MWFLFYRDAKAGLHLQNGWPNICYGVSKIGVTLICPLQQKLFDLEKERKDIVVNAVSLQKNCHV